MPRILRIERASFGSEAWPRKYFLELYRDCRAFFVVAKVGGRIAGYAVACMAKRNAEIASLAVHPDYRRRGVADALMRHTLRELYRSLGFRRVRMVRRYYEDGGDGFLMARAIQ